MVVLNKDLVVGLWGELSLRFGLTKHDKGSAIEMQALAQALDALGVVEKDRFLSDFSTTILRRCYFPFEVGETSERWPFDSQALVITHEAQHVAQLEKLGEARFALEYVAFPTRRATLEAQAYRVTEELRFFLTGSALDFEDYAETFKAYGLTGGALEHGLRILSLSLPTVRRGGISGEASKVAVHWLEAQGVRGCSSLLT